MERKNKIIIFLCIISLFVFLGFAFYLIINFYVPETKGVYVSEVIDGDTFELSDGKIIRLLCVDAPEQGETGYEDSKSFLEHLILHKEIRLENFSGTDKDKYGRLLRFVYVNISDREIFLNKEIIRLGYGEVFEYSNVSCDIVD